MLSMLAINAGEDITDCAYMYVQMDMYSEIFNTVDLECA